jgi:hypothetical protein
MDVLHHCDNPPCCEPVCLFLGTHADNNADKAAKGRARNGQSEKTHCPQGHAFNEVNTYVKPDGSRFCRACGRLSSARYYRKMKEKVT